MTLSLEVSCSIQLSYRGVFSLSLDLVRVERIELSSPAWKAGIRSHCTIPASDISEDMAIITGNEVNVEAVKTNKNNLTRLPI